MCELARIPPTLVRDLRCHSAASVRHAIATGTLQRPFRGVVLGRDAHRDPGTMVRGAQLSVGTPFPASHHSAAALWGFGVIDDGRVHLVGLESEVDRSQPGVRMHSTHREPVTSPAFGVQASGPNRTTIDLARLLTAPDALAVVDAALRTGLVTHESLTTELLEHAGLRGVISARRAVEWGDARAESPQESRLRWIALAAGLPPMDLQIVVHTPSGDFRLDMGWEERRVGVEYDGGWHAGHAQLRYDRARHNALDLDAWRMLYFTDVDLRAPQRTADRMAAAVGVTARRLPGRR